jgi:hypothetical protein
VAISEDDCHRCRVRNPTDSKGNSRGILVVSTAKRLAAAATFVSIDVCVASGMGGLEKNDLDGHFPCGSQFQVLDVDSQWVVNRKAF